MFKPTKLLLFLSFTAILSSCESEGKVEGNEETIVRIREAIDATSLNPLNIRSGLDGYLSMKLFQSLLAFDYENLGIIPVLAESRPEIVHLKNGKVQLNYKIRNEAKWDNGRPITADDVAFTLKIIKNPYSSNIGAYSFYELIEDIRFEEGSQSFSIIFSEKYILNEITSGDFSIIPSFVYDTNGYLQKFTVHQLSTASENLSTEQIDKLKKFDEEFNSVDFLSNSQFIEGSGAYELEEWTADQKIVLKKKKQWWAESLDSINSMFLNNADLLVYEIIKDNATAMLALQNGKIDVMGSVSSSDFDKWKNNDNLQEQFNIFSPDQIAYHYIGLNTEHPILKNVKIRRALRMAIDIDKIIEAVMKGYAEKINGPVPKFFEHHNDTLKAFEYQPESTVRILKEEGWKDTDNDGILEKTINEVEYEMSFDYLYYTDNDLRKFVALIIQEDYRKLGINLNLIPLEWGTFLDRLKNHDFDLFYGSKILAPVPRDHKPIFHSESISKGSNFVALSDPQLDILIDSARTEMDEKKRKKLNWKIQEMIFEQVPYIYLFSPKERIIISKKFTKLNISPLRPGYWEPGFELKNTK